jgi:hypothetical protein
MPLKRCEKGHYYDASKHSTCPSCGVGDLQFKKTEPRRPAPVDDPDGIGDRVRPPAPADDGKTRRIGMGADVEFDPVVGWLVCVEGKNRGRDYRLRREKNFIGRSEAMDVCILGDETISREKHASVSFNPKNNQFKLHPGDGRGLVYLNGEEVDTPVPLKPKDTIEIGQHKLMLVSLCSDEFKWE